MLYNMFHGKIHRATVTEANLEYMGSITIDSELLKLAGIMPGSGVICLNGAAARKVTVGDTVIIIAYALMNEEEAAAFVPKVVLVDGKNRPLSVRGTEKEGEKG